MAKPIDPNDATAICQIAKATAEAARAEAIALGSTVEWATDAYTLGKVAAAIINAVCPPDYVVVLREDVRTMLDDTVAITEAWLPATERLRAAIDDQES